VKEPAGHAFTSYVREDSHHVDQLQQALEAAGINVWRDTANLWPGENWRMKIRNAITDNALVFIARFSSRSTSRTTSYQNEELAVAIDQLRLRRPDVPWLIPVRFDDCPVPDIDLGGGRTLGSIQRADLFGDGCEAETSRLVTAVQRLLEQQSEERRPVNTRETEVVRLQAGRELPVSQVEKLRALLQQQARGQQRDQAGKVYVWEERLSHDPHVSQTQRAVQGGPLQGAITAHVKNGSDQPVYEVTLVWHRGTARWGDNDNLGTLIPGHEAERTRELPPLPDYVDPGVWGAVAFFRDPAGTWWRARPDGQLHDILPEQVPRG
jgi:hypothetical protein